MQEINVFFKPDQVLVDRQLVGIHGGEPVLWQFHSVDPKVQWVDVAFDKFAFFEDRGGGLVPRRYTDVRNGHGQLLGTAPHLPSPASTIDKYWVKGYETQANAKNSADAVSSLDPEIIVCDP